MSDFLELPNCRFVLVKTETDQLIKSLASLDSILIGTEGVRPYLDRGWVLVKKNRLWVGRSVFGQDSHLPPKVGLMDLESARWKKVSKLSLENDQILTFDDDFCGIGFFEIPLINTILLYGPVDKEVKMI